MKKTEQAIIAWRMAEGYSGQPGTREYDEWLAIYKLEHIAATGIDPDELPDNKPGDGST
jgi:hypothetical protein